MLLINRGIFDVQCYKKMKNWQFVPSTSLKNTCLTDIDVSVKKCILNSIL